MVGAAKAMLPDLFPPSEQAAAMSLVTAMWQLGQIVGTAIGGLLAGYPKQYPYLVANAVGSGLAAIAMVGVEIFIPGKKKKDEDDEIVTPLLQRKEDDETPQDVSPRKKKKGAVVPKAAWAPILIYSTFSLFGTIYQEAYPLFLLTDKDQGGSAMHAKDIGMVMSATAVGGVVLQVFVFPPLSRLVTATVLYRRTVFLSAFLTVVTPMIPALNLNKDPNFFLLVAHNIVYQFVTSAAFTAIACCINNSISSKVRGTVNGVAMATASGLRSFGPSTGGGVYSWSLKANVLPNILKGRLIFLISCILYLISGICGVIYLTPKYDWPIDQRTTGDDDAQYQPPPEDKGRPMTDFALLETKAEEDSGIDSPHDLSIILPPDDDDRDDESSS